MSGLVIGTVIQVGSAAMPAVQKMLPNKAGCGSTAWCTARQVQCEAEPRCWRIGTNSRSNARHVVRACPFLSVEEWMTRLAISASSGFMSSPAGFGGGRRRKSSAQPAGGRGLEPDPVDGEEFVAVRVGEISVERVRAIRVSEDCLSGPFPRYRGARKQVLVRMRSCSERRQLCMYRISRSGSTPRT
ncbi:hypothetical protein [Lentzea fradiae]|uniref:hypothetical protein n=1 Tax=Lentzea fradiae TaxID=200378 RepID=UPI00115FACAD|nr:hypothetical protein [Lentzea fradiae]